MTAHLPLPTDRVPDHPAHRIFVDRWSPRGFSTEAIPEAEEFETFLAPPVEFNRGWATHAVPVAELAAAGLFPQRFAGG